jgi:protocatechuate 3,4-dioxygenase beta subunit
MKNTLLLFVWMSALLAACTGPATSQPLNQVDVPTASTSTPGAVPVKPAVTKLIELSTVPAPRDDFFTENGITLPVPTCEAPTVAQTEGPYYTPNTPERHSLLEEGMSGTRLVVVGYVLDANCQPLANAWLDFWQADSNGTYDNVGYTLRGHQFTDGQGRFYLETVVPGEYPGRTEHIHVKVQPQGGAVLTTQLYFPNVASNSSDGIFDPGLIVQLEERPAYVLAYYNFVVK